MSKWLKLHQMGHLDDPPEGAFGFVYEVRHRATGQYYIGMKGFYSMTNAKISKKRSEEIYKGRGKRPGREKKVRESLWRTYNTSSVKFKEFILQEGEEAFDWMILSYHKSKTELQIAEAKVLLGILCDPLCWNAWISLKIYKSNLSCDE